MLSLSFKGTMREKLSWILVICESVNMNERGTYPLNHWRQKELTLQSIDIESDSDVFENRSYKNESHIKQTFLETFTLNLFEILTIIVIFLK